MRELTIGLSPITNTIFAGTLNKRKTMWMPGKQDVTDQAVMAVAGYVKKERIIYERAGKTYELKEVEVSEELLAGAGNEKQK